MTRGARRFFPPSYNFRLLFTIIVLLLPAAMAQTEAFKTQDPGKGYIEVGGKWQFRTGDDLAWAQPGYDDSGWEQLRGDDTWGNQTHPSYVGFAWYRKRIEVTGATGPLAILMPPVDDAYELYWNGEKIGSYGSLPPHASWSFVQHSDVYPLPTNSGVLAIRVWKAPLTTVDPPTLGGLEAAPRIGDPAYLALQVRATRTGEEHRVLPGLLIWAIMLATGLISLLLFVRERNRSLYLWLGLYLTATALRGAQSLEAVRYGISLVGAQCLSLFANCASDLFLWALLLALFGLDRNARWRRWTLVAAGIYGAAEIVDLTLIFLFWQYAGKGIVWMDAMTTAIYTIAPLYIAAILIGGLRRRRQVDLWPLAIVVFLAGLWSIVLGAVSQGLQVTHWDKFVAWMQEVGFSLGEYHFRMSAILNIVLFVMLVFTVGREQYRESQRQAQMEREKDRLARDLELAREIQRSLLPKTTPAIPGYQIAGWSEAADETGGDYFDWLRLSDGRLVVSIADASGHGIGSALMVTACRAYFRAATSIDVAIEQAVARVNDLIALDMTGGRFVTLALCMLDPQKHTLHLFSAGHGPVLFYHACRASVLLSGADGLPLGIFSPMITTEARILTFEPGDLLLLVTDGFFEWENPESEQFGVERLKQFIVAHCDLEPFEFIQTLHQEVLAFARGTVQADDLTAVIIKRLCCNAN
jgi:serine phosphatase RsbU (regulator of sigma subunit)